MKYIWNGFRKVDSQILKLRLWETKEKILMSLGDAIGRDIKVDETSLKKEVGYYASVLVEVDLANTIPYHVEVKSKYGVFEQESADESVQNPLEGEIPKVVPKKIWKLKEKNQQQPDGFDICYTPKTKKSKDVENEDFCEDEVITAILPPFEKVIERTIESVSKSSGKFHVLQELVSEEPSPISVKKLLEVASCSSSVINAVTIENDKVQGVQEVVKKVIKPKNIILITTRKQNATNLVKEKKKVDRRELYTELELVNNMDLPWMLIGDFNTILSADDKMGGRAPLRVAMQDFHEAMNACSLIQASSSGLQYTWCNNKASGKRIVCTLDKAFYNLKWIEKYPDWSYKVGVRSVSDHSPLLGSFLMVSKPNNVPLRVLKKLKLKIKVWNWSVFGDVRVKLAEVERGFLNATLQKSREHWIKEGAANTRFFHTSIKTRHTANAITKLEDESGVIITDQYMVASTLENYFKDKFKFKEVNFIDGVFDAIPKVVSSEDNKMLENILSAQEIKEAVFSMNADSAPSPDGFSGFFYRYAWEVIGEGVINAIRYCWKRDFIPRGLNSNFLFLLPKVKGARRPNQFRPIGLSNFSFKIFTKIMTNRMYGLMGKVISEQQGAFLKGRCIQEQIVLAYEMINKIDTKRRGGNVSRGLRQGDPLSPIFFVIAEDALSRSLSKMVEENKIMLMVNIRGVHPTHILFADDVFLFFNGHKRNIQKVMKLLQDYQSSSDQVINQMKSKLFVGGVSEARKQQITVECQINLFQFPDKYLGVILHHGRLKTSTVLGVAEMLQGRLARWIGKMLSFKDRITLIKSILSSIPIYNMSIYKWHVSVVKICERLIRNFLWTGYPYDRKCVTLKWDDTCAPLEEGGLGIRRLKVINKSLLMKMVWKIHTSDAEWARFMREKFCTVNGEWISGYKKSSIWNGLKWVIDEVRQNTRWITCNDDQISVWRDAWIKEKPLVELYPNDEYIMQNASMKVVDLIVDGEWLVPQRMLYYFQVNELPIISRQEDKRIWFGTMSGEFTISSAVELIRLHYNKVDWAKNVWNSVLHPIITSNVWKLVRDICATDEKMQAS
ncbi:uncharacterized protein LOC113311932 [Papaver somniferum]|uniref:uncharacterized protein LOC113311932 n=1 Tax=Papaver somniferum TaxID=3469 RepID=UPI000E6FB27F|nr:uncharacterized protein LOC113311932 [Papaver somniferum]